jgi:hypothetical protein
MVSIKMRLSVHIFSVGLLLRRVSELRVKKKTKFMLQFLGSFSEGIMIS